MFEDVNWIQIAAALVGGGAAGAIITAAVTAYRARRQPVSKRAGFVPVFRPSGRPEELKAAIAVTHGTKTVTFNNLFLAEVQIINTGNRDLDDFQFGVTLGEGDRCIFVEATSPDRFHSVALRTPVSPDAPLSELDFSLKPFNRTDGYSFKMYIVIPDNHREPKKLEFGSASSVRFVDMPTATELLARAATEAVLSLGPIKIEMRK